MPNKAKFITSTLALSLVLSASVMYTSPPSALAMNNTYQLPAGTTSSPHDKHEQRAGSNSMYDEAANVLKMDKQALMKELQAGKSLADIAKSKNISEETLRSSLLSKQSARIDQALKAGKLTESKADMMKNKTNLFIDQLISKKGVMLHGEHQKQRMLLPSEDKLAKQLGLTADELRDKLKGGKSIAELATEKGISKDQLINSIKEDLTPMIERMINHKNKAE